jgi:hypothetical protein
VFEQVGCTFHLMRDPFLYYFTYVIPLNALSILAYTALFSRPM